LDSYENPNKKRRRIEETPQKWIILGELKKLFI